MRGNGEANEFIILFGVGFSSVNSTCQLNAEVHAYFIYFTFLSRHKGWEHLSKHLWKFDRLRLRRRTECTNASWKTLHEEEEELSRSKCCILPDIDRQPHSVHAGPSVAVCMCRRRTALCFRFFDSFFIIILFIILLFCNTSPVWSCASKSNGHSRRAAEKLHDLSTCVFSGSLVLHTFGSAQQPLSACKGSAQ